MGFAGLMDVSVTPLAVEMLTIVAGWVNMQSCVFFTAGLAIAGSMLAQTLERRADMTGGGNPERGKCTIEVRVDGAAEVEIRGDRAVLRNLAGQPPQWRRFVCNAVMPNNPADFRFAGVDGRGKQQLVRDPRNGGAAVIRIDDPDNGSEGYTFDIFWAGMAPPPGPQRGPGFDRDRDRGGPDQDAYYRDREQWFRGESWRRSLFDRVRNDLEHVRSVTYPRGGDEYRLERTQQELNELQGKLAAGRYDERELDDVIGAMQRVLQDNRLSRRDRDLLADDLDRLRDFRARHDRYGAR
jgi:hypothetical protein